MKNKLILYLALIFVAGGVSGAAIAWSGARQKALRPPTSREMCNLFQHRLQSELGLTSSQVETLVPLLEKRVRQIEEIRGATVRQIEEVIRASNHEIAAALRLDSDQLRKLQSMEKRHKDPSRIKKKYDEPARSP